MEGQNISKPLNKMFLKNLSTISRGIIWGIIGAVTAGVLVGFTYQLFDTFYSGTLNVGIDLNFLDLLVQIVVSIGRSIVEGVIILCIPVGFIIGLSTGTFVVIFRHHCPNLQWWLALSGIGVATGAWFASYAYTDSFDSLTLGGFLLFTFIGSAASWMAYTSTIREIKKSVSTAASQPITIFASLSYLLMIFIMVYRFAFLLEGINTP